MTTTVNGSSQRDVLDVLVGSDKRWATKNHDDPAPDGYLRHLAAAVQPLVDPAIQVDLDTRHAASAELEQLRGDNAKLADQVAALRRQVGQLRADYATVSDERAKLADANAKLGAANVELVAEVEQLRQTVDELVEQQARHSCQWDWSDPTKPIQPCDCGRPWPRYVEYEEEEIEPEVEPWESLFGRLRTEMPDWGDTVRPPAPGAG